MFGNFRKLVFNKYFFKGLFYTFLFVTLLNCGLLFNIPNFFNIEFFDDLSKPVENNITLSLFIGLITIFILFFTFVQFVYSKQSLPSEIIRKYIFEDKISNYYVSILFSLALILGYFSFFENEIYILNKLLSFIFIIFSVLFSLVYFFWLVENVTAVGIISIIMKKFRFDEINKIDKQSYDRLMKFNKNLNSIDRKMKFSKPDYIWDAFALDTPFTITERKGIIKEINLSDLEKIFLPYKDVIKKITINVEIGNYFPRYEQLSDRIPKTVLLSVETFDSEVIPKKDIAKIKELIEKKDDGKFNAKVENCFIFEEKSNIYSENIILIEDLLLFFLNAIEKEPSEAEKIIERLSSFILKEINKYKEQNWLKKIGLRENLYLEFIKITNEQIKYRNIDSIKLYVILSFIYSFRNLAFKNKSAKIISSLLDLLFTLFYRILLDTKNFNSRLSLIILHIQEITISSLGYGPNAPTLKEFCKHWTSFYKPLIVETINRITIVFYYFIKYYHRREEEDNYYILLSNSQQILNILTPLEHWEPVEELFISHPTNRSIRDRRNEFIKYLAEKIVILSIISFKRVTEKNLPKWLLFEIAFPMAKYCNTSAKHEVNAYEFLNQLFFDFNSYRPTELLFSEEFEINKIHESGAYTPNYYNFNKFWFAFAIYTVKEIRNYNEGFRIIPYKFLKKTEFEKDCIKTFISQIDDFDEMVTNLFDLQDEQYEDIKTRIKTHLKKLLMENNETIN